MYRLARLAFRIRAAKFRTRDTVRSGSSGENWCEKCGNRHEGPCWPRCGHLLLFVLHSIGIRMQPSRGKPSAPPPDASSQEVQNFVTAYFPYNEFDQSRARAKAEKSEVNGDGLYRMSREDFVKIFEANGGLLYDIIQYWGYVNQPS